MSKQSMGEELVRDEERPVLLTIAGFDPSSGAGITADLKVFAAYGGYGVSCITALTIQSTQGVRRVKALDASWTAETLQCLHEDVAIAGVKIGMLATVDNILMTARFLAASGIARDRIVLDPVLVSTSGALLLEPAGVDCLRECLMPHVGWITPNLEEAVVLVGMTGPDPSHAPEAARRLRAIATEGGNDGLSVLITGGDLERPDDYLLPCEMDRGEWVPGERVETTATHGTGCALSSALLCESLAGRPAREAVAGAKRYVEESLRRAYKVGNGRGPMHHLHALDDVQKAAVGAIVEERNSAE